MNFEELRERLVEKLISEGILKTRVIIEAMRKVPREEFVLPRYRDLAYEDTPLPIGYGQTISAPHMVAMMTEALKPERGNKVLEIGTGSGYQTAILAEVVGKEGHVWTIERIKELVEFAKENLRRAGYADRVTVIHGDGSLGYEAAAPYDRIMVTAASPKVPEPLLNQLKPEGRLVIPLGDRYLQFLTVFYKDKEGNVKREVGSPCVFVPLVGRYGFPEEWR